MLKHILSTIFSKGIAALSNFVILLLTSIYLGSEGRGEVALIILGISVINLFQGIFSGAVMTYMVPRFPIIPLFLSGFVWNILLALTISPILIFFDLYPKEYTTELLVLSVMQGSIMLFQSSLLGFERIQQQNNLEITKATTTAFFLFTGFYFLKEYTVLSVIYSLYLSYGFCLLLGIKYAIPHLMSPAIEKTKLLTINKQLLVIGTQMQLNNISQMINYRFCFYIIEKNFGLSALGVFSNASSLAELVWIICRSISNVYYGRIVNVREQKTRVQLTTSLAKLSLTLSLPAMLLMCLLPDSLYVFIFGSEFNGIQIFIISMSAGILALSFFTLLNHYYSGTNKNYINLIVSMAGNTATIVSGILLIPTLGGIGGGIATSIGYVIMLLILVVLFSRENEVSNRWFIPKSGEIREIISKLRTSLPE